MPSPARNQGQTAEGKPKQMRENGFYWVRCLTDEYGYDGPVVASWCGIAWELPGLDDICFEEEVIVLSERLQPPLAA